MNLQYKSTRNPSVEVTASQAILKGLADDGGLFVPEKIPALALSLEELKGLSYQETAFAVMKEFLTDFTEEELKECIRKAYDRCRVWNCFSRTFGRCMYSKQYSSYCNGGTDR